jgi:hypothetical protein
MSRLKKKIIKRRGSRGTLVPPVKMRSIDEGIVLWYCVEK